MPLKPCPDCGKDCSEQAPACPHCGRPCAPTVRTIEATGKRFKGIQITGVLLILVGVVAMMSDAGNLAHWALLLGIPIFLYGRIGGWWHHG